MTKVKLFFINALQIQLLLSLISLPILVHWGLPLSLMTFVGNIIFTPLLTIMLMMSSLLFFTELCYIPNSWIAESLNMFVYAWNNTLSIGSNSWLIGFAHPGVTLLALIPLTTIMFLHSHWSKNIIYRIGGMSCILFSSFLLLWGYSHLQKISLLKHDLFTVSQQKNGTLLFTDYGYFNRKPNCEKAIDFELKPYLTKKFGNALIEELIITKPSQRSFLGACALCDHYQIQHITIPYWSSAQKTSKIIWSYQKLQRKVQEKGIILHRSFTKARDL